MEIRRISNDELYHHGIKGQKWGVRRYQNYDGTKIGKRTNRQIEKEIRRQEQRKKARYDARKRHAKNDKIMLGAGTVALGGLYAATYGGTRPLNIVMGLTLGAGMAYVGNKIYDKSAEISDRIVYKHRDKKISELKKQLDTVQRA